MDSDSLNADFENLDSLPFEGLLSKAKSGCEDARAKLVDCVQDYIGVVASQRTINNLKHKCGASDIVQLTMLEVFKSIDNFRGNTEGEFKAWVKAIVDHQVKQTQREFSTQKRNVEKEVRGNDTRNLAAGFVDQQLTPQSDAIQNENQRRMNLAIEQLPADYKQVIELRSLQRMPFKQIAEQMNRSEDAATRLWFRAITKLQSLMKGDNDSFS